MKRERNEGKLEARSREAYRTEMEAKIKKSHEFAMQAGVELD